MAEVEELNREFTRRVKSDSRDPSGTRREPEPDASADSTAALGQLLCIYADEQRKQHHNANLVFTEDHLREVLGKDAPRLRAVLDHLRDKGRAKKTPIPGDWFID